MLQRVYESYKRLLDDWFYAKAIIGKDGKEIVVYKVRTMFKDADARWEEVVAANGIGSYGKIKDDPRIIPSRRWMRRRSVDELPQIPSIFKGDLSLVGIRGKGSQGRSIVSERTRQRAFRFRPGFIPAQYAYKGLDTPRRIEASMRLYLRQKEHHPLWTDTRHLAVAVYNHFTGKVRNE